MKNPMVKTVLYVACMATLLGSGCVNQQGSDAMRQGTAKNDILTFEPVSKDKLLITMRGEDNINADLLERAIELQFPEVDIVFSNNTNILDLKVKNFEDIYLTSSVQYLTMWEPESTFLNLSNQKFVNNYYSASLNSCTYEGSLYYLPGPSTVTGIVYNKDMFEENDWKIPKSLTEFESLCETINATGIRAYQPSLYYYSSTKAFFVAFNYSTVFAGLDNIYWLEDYKKGEETMVGHMEPAFERMQQCLEKGIFESGDFEVQPGLRSRMMYKDHTCAMIHEGLDAVRYAKEIGGADAPEVGMMPYWSGDGPNDDYVFSECRFYIAVNKKLEDPGSEEKLQAVLEILEYLSTPEGQEAAILSDAPLISPLKDSTLPEGAFTEEILETLKKGHLLPYPMYGKTLVTSTDITFRNLFQEFLEGTKTAQEVMEGCDNEQLNTINADPEDGFYSIGSASEDFTVLETAEYIADIFRRKTDSDIGLCRANTRVSGCQSEIYKGDIQNFQEYATSAENICYNLDRGFGYALVDDDLGACLVQMSMSGADIKAALNEVYNGSEQYPADCIVASGLKIEFAPWAGEGNRLVSVTLADGSELEPEKEYTVAAWNGTVDPQRITKIESACEETFLEIFEEAVKQDSPIAPFKDDRFVLNWGKVEE